MVLIELLPSYYHENKVMGKLQNVLSKDLEDLLNGSSTTVDQCFINTATSLLARYEKIYGIKTDIGKSDEIRRGKIKAKMAGTGTFTKRMLANITKAYEGGNSEVVEDNPSSFFSIKFNDYHRVPSDKSIEEIYTSVNELKPAHLGFDHTFTYNWWGMGDDGVWDDGGTWDDLRNYEEE